MESTRDIKKRIKSVKNIQQITRTMEMVAAAKLRRAQNAARRARPYAEKIRAMMRNIGNTVGSIRHPLLKDRPIKKVAIVVVTSNKGLCGAFNNNVLRKVEKHIKKYPDPKYSFFCIGKKGKDYLSRREHNIIESYIPSEKEIDFSQVIEIVRNLSTGFENEEYDQIQIFFSRFISVMVQRPAGFTLIPFVEQKDDEKPGTDSDYLFEPDPEELMAELIPKYLECQVYDALVESRAGEQASRLIAMKNATDNSKEMIKILTLSYNKARQASITTEILEIVSGAEAIKAG